MYAIVLPILYQSVVLRLEDEHRFEVLGSVEIGPACDKGYFRYTRSVEVTSPFHVNTGPHRRCMHHNPWTATLLEDTLASSLLHVLKACGDGTLRSFR